MRRITKGSRNWQNPEMVAALRAAVDVETLDAGGGAESKLLADIFAVYPDMERGAAQFTARRMAALGLERLPRILGSRGLFIGLLHYTSEAYARLLWQMKSVREEDDPNLGFSRSRKQAIILSPPVYLRALEELYRDGNYHDLREYNRLKGDSHDENIDTGSKLGSRGGRGRRSQHTPGRRSIPLRRYRPASTATAADSQ